MLSLDPPPVYRHGVWNDHTFSHRSVRHALIASLLNRQHPFWAITRDDQGLTGLHWLLAEHGTEPKTPEQIARHSEDPKRN